MRRYSIKPPTVEALQWTGKNPLEMCEFLGGSAEGRMAVCGSNFKIDHRVVDGGLVIKTLGVEHRADICDFIVRDAEGVHYPLKPDVFKLTYSES